MASTTEAELGGLFEKLQTAKSIQTAQSEMCHPQPPMPVTTYNTAVNIIVNGTSKQKISRAICMILYWRKEKPGGLFHQTLSDFAPQNYATNIFETNKKRHGKIKRTAKWNRTKVC